MVVEFKTESLGTSFLFCLMLQHVIQQYSKDLLACFIITEWVDSIEHTNIMMTRQPPRCSLLIDSRASEERHHFLPAGAWITAEITSSAVETYLLCDPLEVLLI